ncbi:MAG: CotH kinase family protein [Eubacteriales bacterium]|nr:CotH kinase family protein [Eubacteriales bacterium]
MSRLRWMWMCALLLCLTACAAQAEGKLCVNELCSSNKTCYLDYYGQSSDWIELYNGTDAAIELEGWSLSKDEDRPRQFVFSARTLEAGERLLLSAATHASHEKEPCVGFKLSSDGGVLRLYQPDGTLCDQVAFPSLKTDTSYGRVTDGGDEFSVLTPTPGASNNDAQRIEAAPDIDAPGFSMESGFYDSPFELTLTCQPGQTIYYTLDCTSPTQSSSLYSAPLAILDPSSNPNVFSARTDIAFDEVAAPADPVDKAVVVRAVACDAQGHLSEVVSKTYFIGFADKSGYDAVPVLSLVAEPDDLFGKENGIYVLGNQYDEWLNSDQYSLEIPLYSRPANFLESGYGWEKTTYCELFESGAPTLQQTAGMRIQGNLTRTYVQKSFKLYARSDYGADVLEYDFYTDTKRHSTVELNAGGNDRYFKLRNLFMQSLVASRDLATESYRPCVIFLNGEYWGLYNMRERYCDEFFEDHYQVDDANLIVVKNGKLSEGGLLDIQYYNEYTAFVQQANLTREEDWARLQSLIDVQSYIDYMCTEIFLANGDWVLPSGMNNYSLWRTRTAGKGAYEDCRWRWAVVDLDVTAGYNDDSRAQNDTFSLALAEPLFAKALQNDEFLRRFLNTFMDMVNVDFRYDTVAAKLNEVIAVYQTPTLASNHRFYPGNYDQPTAYRKLVTQLKSFFKARPDYLIGFVRSWLGEGYDPLDVTVTLSGAAGCPLTVNGAPVSLQKSWNGRYFPGSTVTLAVTEDEQRHFIGWMQGDEVLSTALSCTVTLTDAPIALTAVFSELETAAELSLPSDLLTEAVECDLNQLCEDQPETTAVQMQTDELARWLALDSGEFMAVLAPAGEGSWNANTAMTFAVPTTGYSSLQLYLNLCAADQNSPREFALEYSLDGEMYQAVPGSDASLARSKAVYQLYAGVSLPDALNDRTLVYLRLRVRSGKTLRGADSLFGSHKGGIVVTSLRVKGLPLSVSFAGYRDAVEYAQAHPAVLSSEQVTAYLAESIFDDEITQSYVNACTSNLTNAVNDELLALSKLDMDDVFADQPALAEWISADHRSGNVDAFLVSDDLARHSMQLRFPIDASRTAAETGLYFWNGTELTQLMIANETTHQRFIYRRSVPGLYLILYRPLWTYQLRYEYAYAELPQALQARYLLSNDSELYQWLTLEPLCERFCGDLTLHLTSGWTGGVYLYRLENDELVDPQLFAADVNSRLKLSGMTAGKYLLLYQPVIDRTDLPARPSAS